MNIFKQLCTMVLLLLSISAANAKYKAEYLPKAEQFAVKQTLSHSVNSHSTVVLDANQFQLPKKVVQYSWRQLNANSVKLHGDNSDMAHFTAPVVKAATKQTLAFELMVIDDWGRFSVYHANYQVQSVGQTKTSQFTTLRNDNEILIPASYHPLGNELVAVINLPEGASAENPVPGCAIIHGSGGLFKEEGAGISCSEDLENTYQEVSDQLFAQGIATILPSSFYSRDEMFCEDNESQYLAYGTAPFFNQGDVHARDTSYKIRRVAIRTMDMLATMSYFCDLDEVDCANSCMVGTSNGGTSILAYNAQSLPTDLLEFMDDSKREFEYNSTRAKRETAFANFPALTISEEQLALDLTHRPLPQFAQLVSPGCSMRDLVQHIDPADEEDPFSLTQLYYPADDTSLHFEVGTNDGVPDECYIAAGPSEGDREIQARYYEQEMNILPQDSQYNVHVHQGGGHSLLRDDDYSGVILQRLDDLVGNW